MRSRSSLLCGILLVISSAIVTTLAGDPSSQPQLDPVTLEELQEKIAALEARVATLEAERSGVQQAAGIASETESVPGLQESETRRLPGSSKQGEINGVPFYTLPLGRSGRAD